MELLLGRVHSEAGAEGKRLPSVLFYVSFWQALFVLHWIANECLMQFQPGIGNDFRHSGCDHEADSIDCTDGGEL